MLAEAKGRWLCILRRIGQVQEAILWTAIYLLLWIPVGLVCRLLVDWLHYRPRLRSGWIARVNRLNDPRHLQELF